MGCHAIQTKECKATYQRAVNLKLHDLIGKNMEVYIDNVVVKSVDFLQHLTDLEQSFIMIQLRVFTGLGLPVNLTNSNQAVHIPNPPLKWT